TPTPTPTPGTPTPTPTPGTPTPESRTSDVQRILTSRSTIDWQNNPIRRGLNRTSEINTTEKLSNDSSLNVSPLMEESEENTPTPTPTPTPLPEEEREAIQQTSQNTQIFQAIRTDVAERLDLGEVETAIELIDGLYTEELGAYIGQDFSVGLSSTSQLQRQLQTLEARTGQTAVAVYAFSRRDRIDLIALPPAGSPIYHSITAASVDRLIPVLRSLRINVTSPRKRDTDNYLADAQQLYQWLIAPLEADLERMGADTLLFSFDAGLRALPIAALHDGSQFLVEKYRLALVPSLNLTDTNTQSLDRARVLAMGVAEFPDQGPLPAVPVELSAIVLNSTKATEPAMQGVWPGDIFLNSAFTLDNLKAARNEYPYSIIHLATHAEFLPGSPSNSYIQLWNGKLGIDRLRELNWHEPPVELLVLSACRTALGDETAELGFAGLAVQAGVKTALASLWDVSDRGTLGLMSEFYQQLHNNSPAGKAEALRQAQLAMLSGQVRLENAQLVGTHHTISLPPELANVPDQDLSHPYYWSAFTIVGSPW
ncbi:MAG: CHAT domain-containing protein, partial [Geitlerinemataceae cyanobacterium]